MKTRSYKTGRWTYKAYMKPAGKGYEVGFLSGTKTLFVGNFINPKEAMGWYQLMNKEYSRFSKKYGTIPPQAKNFYNKFIYNTLYKHYYDYLDKCFGKHTKNYHREFNKDSRRYIQMKKNWTPIHLHSPASRRSA